MTFSDRQTYSRSETAAALSCSEATIDRMIRAGQLRSTQIGKRRNGTYVQARQTAPKWSQLGATFRRIADAKG